MQSSTPSKALPTHLGCSAHEPASALASVPPALPQRARARPRWWGTGAFVLGSLILGTVGIFVQESGTDPLTATWFRCALGVLGLTLWLCWRGQWPQLRLSRRTVLPVLATGVLMVSAWGIFFYAIPHTGAGVATMLFHIQPLWLLVVGRLWLGERVARQRWWGVWAALLGLLLATGVVPGRLGAADVEGALTASPGHGLAVGLCLMGSALTAALTLLTRHLRHMPPAVLAWWQCTLGMLVLWWWPMAQGWPAWGAAWGWLAGLGLLHTATAYVLLYTGMARLATQRIAVLQFIYPAAALLIDWVVYAHRLNFVQCMGLLLMALAIWWAERPASSTE